MKTRIFEDERIFMNTNISIKIVSNLSTVESYELIDKAFSKFQYVVNKFSRFDKNSELSKLNRNSGRKFIASKELFELTKRSLKISRLSNYIFDPTIIDVLERFGYKKNSKIREVAKTEIDKLLKNRPKPSEIILDEEQNSIKLTKNQRIDFGSIGKGYAVDLASEELNPVQNFMINAGGDVFAKGLNHKGQKWKIGLNIPNSSNEIFGYVELDSESLASSGNWANNYKSFSHIINPKLNQNKDSIDQCFVINKSAAVADGYATMLFLTGIDGLDILEKKGVGGLAIRNNRIYKNKYFP